MMIPLFIYKALAGKITIDDDVAKKIKDVRDGASHATDNLVSSYAGVQSLARVKSECLRILGSLHQDHASVAGA